MDQAKTTQALKRIFDQCGTGVLQDRRRFEAYLEDLLPGSACSTERMVLRHALDSSALTLLLRSPALTADAAGRAVEQLQRESRMNAEDAEFVVRCTIAARGGDPSLADKLSQPPGPTSRPAPPPASPPPRSAPAPSPKPAPAAQTFLCSLARPGTILMRQGEVRLCPDRLIFTPSTVRKQTELLYKDMTKIEMKSQSQIISEMWKMVAVICLGIVAIMLVFLMPELGEEGVIISVAALIGVGLEGLVLTILVITGLLRPAILAHMGRRRYSFDIKDQRQREQMYATLQQGIHRNT